jgi:hypothetical protein
VLGDALAERLADVEGELDADFDGLELALVEDEVDGELDADRDALVEGEELADRDGLDDALIDGEADADTLEDPAGSGTSKVIDAMTTRTAIA